jgi:hypothetical protein
MSSWPIIAINVRIGMPAAAVAVPNEWRRSWKRNVGSSCAAFNACR